MKKSTSIESFIVILISCLVSGTSTGSEKLVIDTDAGADDATAILLLLAAWTQRDSNFEIVAITCTYGNTAEQNVEQNVLKTITIANTSNIPVYGGAQKSLTTNFTSDNYFGEDGFGDFKMNDKIIAKINESYHAAVLLVNLAKQYPKQLNILVLGPLTNVALAISLDPNFTRNIKNIYIMGGSVAGLGNWAPGIEYNFAADPVSNFIVFQSLNKPSLLFPWETIIRSNISMEWRVAELGHVQSRIMQFLNQAERISLNGRSIWKPADAMTAAAMIWPELVEESVVVNIFPVKDGDAKGTLLVDYTNMTGRITNAKIVQKFNAKAFMDKLLYYFS